MFCSRYLLVLKINLLHRTVLCCAKHLLRTKLECVAGRLKFTLFGSDCVNRWQIRLPVQINLCKSSYQRFHLAGNAVTVQGDCSTSHPGLKSEAQCRLYLSLLPSACSSLSLNLYCFCEVNGNSPKIVLIFKAVGKSSWVVGVSSTALYPFESIKVEKLFAQAHASRCCCG